MRRARWIRQLIPVALLSMLGVAAAAQKPDISLVEYQAFRPNLYFGLNGGPDVPMMAAIRSESQWWALWAQLEPKIPRDMDQHRPYPYPPLDFSRKVLLVAALGTKATGGYSVSIHSVVESTRNITVNLIVLAPAKNCGVTLTTANPIALALIPKTSKPVEFATTQAELICN